MGYLIEATQFYVCMLPCFVAFQLVVWYLCKKNDIAVSAQHIIGLYLLSYVMITMLSVTGAAVLFAPGISFDINLSEVSLIPFQWGEPRGILLNLLMFIPYGFLLPLLSKRLGSISKVLLSGFLFSLAIELSQLLNHRATDIDDLLMNTAGAVVGYLLYAWCSKKGTSVYVKKWRLPEEKMKEHSFFQKEITYFVVFVFLINFLVKPFVIQLLFL
ncbi:MAG: VanZ family protein [Christensenellaceae bacterium]